MKHCHSCLIYYLPSVINLVTIILFSLSLQINNKIRVVRRFDVADIIIKVKRKQMPQQIRLSYSRNVNYSRSQDNSERAN